MTMSEFKNLCRAYLQELDALYGDPSATRDDIDNLADAYMNKLDKDWQFVFEIIASWQADMEAWLNNA